MISKEEIGETRKQWRLALVGRFLGKRMDSNFIARSWGSNGKLTVMHTSFHGLGVTISSYLYWRRIYIKF